MAWLYLLLSAAAYAASNVVLIRGILPPTTVAPRWRTPAVVGFVLLSIASGCSLILWFYTEHSVAEITAMVVLFFPQILFLFIWFDRREKARVPSGRTD
jgi:hypothetical protein